MRRKGHGGQIRGISGGGGGGMCAAVIKAHTGLPHSRTGSSRIRIAAMVAWPRGSTASFGFDE